MTTTKRTAAASIPGSGWVRPCIQLVEIAWSAPVVIAYRTARIVTGGWPPSARDRREYGRMVQEKVEALGQAAVAAVAPRKDRAAALTAVLAPVHRRVVANRRRLSRR